MLLTCASETSRAQSYTYYEVAQRTSIQCLQPYECFDAYGAYELSIASACTGSRTMCVTGPLWGKTCTSGCGGANESWTGWLAGTVGPGWPDNPGPPYPSTCVTPGNAGYNECQNVSANIIGETGTAPANVLTCDSSQGQGTYQAAAGSQQSTAYGKGAANCTYSSNDGVCVKAGGASTYTCVLEYSGATDSAATAGSPNTEDNCVSSTGGTTCIEKTGTNAGECALMPGGDEACPGALPPGQCTSYGTGGMACSGNAGQPMPTGEGPQTSGGDATPNGTVTNTQTTTNYYNNTTVTSTTSTVASSGGGQTVGSTGEPLNCVTGPNGTFCAGTSSGGSGGGGTVTNGNAAADGDCSANDCSGSGNPLPTYDWSADSWSGATTSFWNSVSSGPIGSAIGGISSNWPSGGSCPSETVPITTLGSYVADYGTPFCNTWAGTIVPILSTVMLAVWSISAVYIFLSA